MKKNIIVLDAYNVIHRIPELAGLLEKSLRQAREGLFRFCSSWLASRNDVSMFYVVFDGQSGVTEGDYQPARGIRPVFTRTGEKADTRIIQIVEERSSDCSITVVSDDNFVRRHSKFLDARVISAQDFFTTPSSDKSQSVTNPQAFDKNLSQKQIRDINNSLKREWGIE